MTDSRTIHASAVLVGSRAVLVRGPSGSGKSRLAWSLIEAGLSGQLPFVRLIADDRVHADAVNGRLVLRTPVQLQGMIEIRGMGIRRVCYEPAAIAGLVVDLAAPDSGRLPQPAAEKTEIAGIGLARLAVASGVPSLPLVLAVLRTN